MSEGHAKVLEILENGSKSSEELEPKMRSNSPRLMLNQLMENSSELMVRATS
jgi:predicted transcriptional regulator